MTTSEFIIGHSEDDAAERKDEPRKILFALVAALLIHLLVGYSIAVSGKLFSPQPVAAEDKPMELTMVDLSTPAPVTKKNTMFMDTPDSRKVEEAPKEQTFESNANSRAASQQAATGDAPLPSQQGKDRPSIDLETHQASLANQGAAPRPSIAPQETPQPSATPTPQPTPTPPEQFAMLRATPTPSPETKPSSTPQQQASSYQPFKEQTRQSGRITNRGIASVNAVGTPLGRYKKLLYDSVGSRWYRYIAQRGDMAGIGTAHVVFSIDRSGHVQNLKMIENTSNETFANICLQSIMEVELPPIPEELAGSLPPEGLVDDITFTMFAN
jgi:outer membrane biosynthesis protein TonB